MISFKFEGAAEIERAMRELPGSVSRAAARRVGRRALGIFIAEVQARAPVETGRLKESFIISSQSIMASRARQWLRRRGFTMLFAGSTDVAGQMQEFGTINHPAQPFARTAWESTRQQVFNAIRDEFAAEVGKTAVRYRRRMAKKG